MNPFWDGTMLQGGLLAELLKISPLDLLRIVLKNFQSVQGVLELWECFRRGQKTMHLMGLWWCNQDKVTRIGWGG